jgi:2-keto-4-pentenoate hydratase/2-oxohepta-3-ene-1,7-dioic acid hydratase in catechol pathway
MKLLRYGPAGQEKPGMLDRQGKIRDLSAKVTDITGAQLSPKVLDDLRRIDPESLPLVPGAPRIGPCVGGISKLVCVGLNYSDHAAETGAPVPTEPILFMKATTAICGPNDEVIMPRGSKKSDWEVELGIVIGTKASYVPKERSLDHVAGYCIVNDVSEREFQMERLGQWTKGKSADTFAPIGPWMVSKDEVADPQSFDLYLDVNGERRQRGNTRTMIFGVEHLLSYISQFMTLLPGDVIPTGTPPGVGLGMKPPVFLKPGDVMRLGISGLGEQIQKVVAPPR